MDIDLKRIDGNLISREWLFTNVMVGFLFPELPLTAAEAMDGEMPVGSRTSANWAAGPTLGEVFWGAEEQ